ncbi:phospholipase A(1) DAD1, chloroplastic, partial [Jatropha curcas]
MRLPVGAARPTTLPYSASKHLELTLHSPAYYSHLSPPLQNYTKLSMPRFDYPVHLICHLATNYSAKLGKKWQEYQGINNWEGLLDPLDDKLRREILRYGQFVEAAYRSFDFDPSSPTYATSKFPRNSLLSRSGIGQTGYRMTKNLRATCGLQLPRWIDRAP